MDLMKYTTNVPIATLKLVRPKTESINAWYHLKEGASPLVDANEDTLGIKSENVFRQKTAVSIKVMLAF